MWFDFLKFITKGLERRNESFNYFYQKLSENLKPNIVSPFILKTICLQGFPKMFLNLLKSSSHRTPTLDII